MLVGSSHRETLADHRPYICRELGVCMIEVVSSLSPRHGTVPLFR